MRFGGRKRIGLPIRRLILSSCVVSPLLLVAARPSVGPAHSRVADVYPEWFLRTPDRLTAVGFAPVYLDTALSIIEATANGRDALRLARGVRVSAEYLQETLPTGGVVFRGEHYVEDTLAAPLDTAFAVDTAYLRRMVLVLVSATPRTLPPTRLAAVPRTAPAWVSESPATSDGAVSVGAAASHFDEIQAWAEAERQARRSLAYSAVTRMRSALESRTGGTSNGALIASTATDIRDVRVVERWRDADRLYVLVHAGSVAARTP